MRKFIVTTTINPPTEALVKFSKLPDWTLIVIGDLKTPHEEYEKIDCTYLSPQEQKDKYPNLSAYIGWNCIQRRNIGFIEAYKRGADIIATVDDDNIPLRNWGKNLFPDEVDYFETDEGVFDPLSATSYHNLWHRGYPLELLPVKNNIVKMGKIRRRALVQADLWNGDPDIDAIARIAISPRTLFLSDPFCSNKPSPFNSQNTFLKRDCFPQYYLFTGIGRMDDIWASYLLQKTHPNSVIYGSASVIQKRNKHDLVKDLKDEMIGYEKGLAFALNPEISTKYFSERALMAYEEYKKYFK